MFKDRGTDVFRKTLYKLCTDIMYFIQNVPLIMYQFKKKKSFFTKRYVVCLTLEIMYVYIYGFFA